ncbi:MAG: YqeG family HAD IIIA-type phosphatase [Clostridia bacterium]|nr:YqeG family HAD IIIA-type phosphatase [Clostridia bacterium]
MIFEKLLVPDLCTEHYYDITPETVKSMGGSALLCDIDNTLVTYDDPVPTPRVLQWIENMESSGVKIAFVSNNKPDRVEAFNEGLRLTAYADAGKPKTKYLAMALKDMGVEKDRAILLGDQLLTDCAAAKRFGIPAIIVPPIKDKKTLFFRFKRWLEIPYMKKYKKMHSR